MSRGSEEQPNRGLGRSGRAEAAQRMSANQDLGARRSEAQRSFEGWDGRNRLAVVFPARIPEVARRLEHSAHKVVLDAELPDGRWVVWLAGSETQVLNVRGVPGPEGMWRLKAAASAWPPSKTLDIVLITRRPFLIYDALNDLDLPYQVECHGNDFYFAIG